MALAAPFVKAVFLRFWIRIRLYDKLVLDFTGSIFCYWLRVAYLLVLLKEKRVGLAWYSKSFLGLWQGLG